MGSTNDEALTEAVWSGALTGRHDPEPQVLLKAWAPRPPGAGGSAPRMGLDVAMNGWWVKPFATQGALVPVAELVVGLVGALIGAPVCTVAIVAIPEDLADATVPAGLAYGSLDIPGGTEIRVQLTHRPDDDNRRRHVGVHALYDWCWGDDPQWLLDPSADWMLHSHDHGFYLPPAGASWSAAELRRVVDEAHPLPDTRTDDLHPDAIDEVSQRLDDLTHNELVTTLMNVPTSWLPHDGDAEVLGWYLERRAPQVASRLRNLVS